MNIVCCQLDVVWENKTANYERTRRLLASANVPAGSLVLLPEMFSTGFSMNVAAIAEGEARDGEKFLAHTAEEFRSYLLGGVVTATAEGRGRNEAVIFAPDGPQIARYCKMHPFTPGGETKRYQAGQGVVTFHWHDFVVSPFICYDLRFPEVFRLATRRGAQLFVVIASWPATRDKHWIQLLQARAIENQAYVAGVNRCGRDPKFTYSGRSLIIDPRGEILADAGHEEKVIQAVADLKGLTAYRSELPFLEDMRWVQG
jgi:predicted amidohydrolase